MTNLLLNQFKIETELRHRVLNSYKVGLYQVNTLTRESFYYLQDVLIQH